MLPLALNLTTIWQFASLVLAMSKTPLPRILMIQSIRNLHLLKVGQRMELRKRGREGDMYFGSDQACSDVSRTWPDWARYYHGPSPNLSYAS